MRNQVGAATFVGSYANEVPVLGLPEIAFAGRSNVGKSSALNKLLNSKSIARVSNTPGRTQMINLFKVGTACVFADLPGYGFARVPPHLQEQWKGMIEGYLGTRDALKLVIVLVDSRHPPQESDGTMLWGLVEAGIPAAVIATKVDKLKKNERARNLAKLKAEFRVEVFPFSSVTGEGRDAVWDRIEAAIRG